ncbi:MAG: agmatine deiminase [Lachnospiraceae bacterium]|nr:agmatine deiminase [Lachnospiraceae bacterium]
MRITKTTPLQDGFYMPAEFSPQEGCILIWPHRKGSWPYEASDAEPVFARMIGRLLKTEKVWLVVEDKTRDRAKSMIEKFAEPEVLNNLCYMNIETDDAWARDTAPTFVTNGSILRGVNWMFNAWGGEYDGLYSSWEKDDALAASFCENLGTDYYDAGDFVLEGGSIHSDGEGTVMVTESCLLSPGRNPKLTKAQIEDKLKAYLGAKKIIWLPCGIYNDETNEHVDNVCAFYGPGKVLLAWTDDKQDPQYEMSLRDLELLQKETDAKGRHFEIKKVLIPKNPVTVSERDILGYEFEEGEDVREVGERLAASYVNFYVGNGIVLVPQFNDENDENALGVMRQAFPDREVVGIDAVSLIVGGGNIHCLTQQIPACND